MATIYLYIFLPMKTIRTILMTYTWHFLLIYKNRQLFLETDIFLWEIYFRLGAQDQGTLSFSIKPKPYMPFASFEFLLSHNSVSSGESSFSSCFLNTYFSTFPHWGLNVPHPWCTWILSPQSLSIELEEVLFPKEIIFASTFLSDSFPFWGVLLTCTPYSF